MEWVELPARLSASLSVQHDVGRFEEADARLRDADLRGSLPSGLPIWHVKSYGALPCDPICSSVGALCENCAGLHVEKLHMHQNVILRCTHLTYAQEHFPA